MATAVIGPFSVINATQEQINDVRVVAARLPAAMRSTSGGLVTVDFGPRPKRAPKWAEGLLVGENRIWVSGRENSSRRQYTIAHEYWHEWSRTHTSTENQIRQLIQGSRGNTQTSRWTNDPDEGMADAFGKALGFSNAPRNYEWRAFIPQSSYSHMLMLLNGGSPMAPPSGGTTGNPVFPPSGGWANLPIFTSNAQHARTFLTWWNTPANWPDHDALANWSQIVERFEIDTGDKEAGIYIRQVLKDLQIPNNVAIGVLSPATEMFMNYLASVIGPNQDPGAVGFDPFGGITGFLTDITDQVSHAFFFLIFIIIGLVILIAGVKSRPSKGATE